MKKFEYKRINSGTMHPDKITKTLNQSGEEGWELILIQKANLPHGNIYVFKREKEFFDNVHTGPEIKHTSKLVDVIEDYQTVIPDKMTSAKFHMVSADELIKDPLTWMYVSGTQSGGPYKFSNTSKERLKTCHEDLQKVMELALRRTTIDFGISQGYRTVQEQRDLYAQGRTKPGAIVTYIDGVTKLSNHNYNPSRAIDIYAWIGRATWDIKHLCYLAGVIMSCADELCVKLRWGGNFDMDGEIGEQNFTDMPHFEIIDI